MKELLEKYGALIYWLAEEQQPSFHFCSRKEVLDYEDLGAQALLRLKVEQFPLLVAYDAQGGDIFKEGKIKYRNLALYNEY